LNLQIKQLFEDQDFSTKLNSTERRDWKAVESVYRNFLGNEEVKNYSGIVQELISPYSAMGCNLSLKLNFLHSQLEFFFFFFFFPENMGAVSDERGKGFHQDISQIENRYNVKRWLTAAGVL
jgi:hypothetical protein